jgi:hypothetical protein
MVLEQCKPAPMLLALGRAIDIGLLTEPFATDFSLTTEVPSPLGHAVEVGLEVVIFSLFAAIQSAPYSGGEKTVDPPEAHGQGQPGS